MNRTRHVKPGLAVLIGTAALLLPRAACADRLPKLGRSDVFAAYYLGFSAGAASLDSGASRSANADPGLALGLTLGVAFAHEFPINFGFGTLLLKDRQPFSEFVVTCSSYEGTDLGCTDPEAQTSQVSGRYLSLDGGYQPRFQLYESLALLPGALIGYQWNPGALKRGVDCEGCSSIPISGVSAAGAYLAPALRLVFTEQQFLALSVRSQWFFTGDMQHVTSLGFEFLAP